MGNIMSYLDWRGDLTFRQSPFNEVDNLILSQISYIDFDGIVPLLDNDEDRRDCITIEEAAKGYFFCHSEEEILAETSFIHMTPFLLRKMAETRRFRSAQLSMHINNIDLSKQMQFAALHIKLSDGTTYISFGGTDDTIIGWKEDFNMSFQTVPSQLEAVKYLENTTHGFLPRYRLGGHSKGGNLAIYAAVMCSKRARRRIKTIYNNDGPGFTEDMLRVPEYKEILDKVQSYAPENTIIGMLLESDTDYAIVGSSQKGILQHDAMSWEVLGDRLVRRTHRTRESIMFEDTFKGWLRGLDNSQKQKFVNDFFNILQENGARTLTDISSTHFKGMSSLLKAFGDMDEANKEVIAKLLSSLTNEYTKRFVKPFVEKIFPTSIIKEHPPAKDVTASKRSENSGSITSLSR